MPGARQYIEHVRHAASSVARVLHVSFGAMSGHMILADPRILVGVFQYRRKHRKCFSTIFGGAASAGTNDEGSRGNCGSPKLRA